MKRIHEEDLVLMLTDKSGKFCITTKDEYKKMGADQTKNDKLVGRDRIREIEVILNGLCTAWAKLWLSYKDHKKEKGKSRPIAAQFITKRFSNSVSNFLETVANSQN